MAAVRSPVPTSAAVAAGVRSPSPTVRSNFPVIAMTLLPSPSQLPPQGQEAALASVTASMATASIRSPSSATAMAPTRERMATCGSASSGVSVGGSVANLPHGGSVAGSVAGSITPAPTTPRMASLPPVAQHSPRNISPMSPPRNVGGGGGAPVPSTASSSASVSSSASITGGLPSSGVNLSITSGSSTAMSLNTGGASADRYFNAYEFLAGAE